MADALTARIDRQWAEFDAAREKAWRQLEQGGLSPEEEERLADLVRYDPAEWADRAAWEAEKQRDKEAEENIPARFLQQDLDL
jgi:hypothetical protein